MRQICMLCKHIELGRILFTPIVLTIKILDLLLTNLVCDASAIRI